MSMRYKGGVLSATAPTTSSSAAPGIWTLEQQMQATAGTGWPFGGPFTYIEDVFSTWLYTGNNSTQTITNGINLSANGGMVWSKSRSAVGDNHVYDTARGIPKVLFTNGTNPSTTYTNGSDLSSFNTTGFSLGPDDYGTNTSGVTYVSWTFREQAKFFDVVTYTGNGAAARAISHNLGSVPGCMIVKRTDSTGDWRVYHRGCSTDNGLVLNDTAAQSTSAVYWFGNDTNVIPPTSTQFTINSIYTNINGATYVAYLFAHNAGGFGLSGSDNVISCGSCAGGSGTTVTLGYEPQWLLVKKTNGAQNWFLVDNMRGLNANQGDQALSPNTTGAEPTASSNFNITSTGFVNAGLGTGSDTYIYIAIRRGPMKVPTSGTSVFSPVARAGTGASTTVNTSVRPDAIFQNWRAGAYGSSDHYVYDRLRGFTLSLFTNLTDAEVNQTVSGTSGMGNSSYGILNTGMNASGGTFVDYAFTRAPSFFDEVCFTATGTSQSVSHNLQAVPELMICKRRDSATGGNWTVYSAALGNTKILYLNQTAAQDINNNWDNTTPTSTTFNVNNNINGGTYVNYLFATCASVSKVGSYTGTAALLTVNCGFTAGARFVLIKRTDSTGDWYTYDSARGISSGNDPYLLLNSTAAETTGTNYVDTDTTGFKVTAAAPAGLNASGGTYIFLAIA